MLTVKKSLSMIEKRVQAAALTVKQKTGQAKEVMENTSGLEAFEIAIGVGIAVVLGVIALSNNKDLITNTIWPKVTSAATSLFS